MTIRYGSVCSGIEAATMAWHGLGWSPAFFAEIEKFPSAVLAHHYGSNMPGEPLATNGVPNYGDFTQIGADAGPVDLLVGGTPCQSFSVAGKRLGLDDPRGNLALEYLALARRLGARWILWENVPGVLSSRSSDEPGEDDEGAEGLESADFATFLSFVQECGYGFAYRVLDAQYVRVDEHARATPQRRRRVFVVGYFGDWRRAAAVLLEPEGMRWDSAPSRKTQKGVAGTVDASAARSRGAGVSPGAITAAYGLRNDAARSGEAKTESIDASGVARKRDAGFNVCEGFAPTLDAGAPHTVAHAIQAGALRVNPDAGPDGAGVQEDVAYTLEARPEVQAVAFDLRGREGGSQFEGPHDSANIRAGSGGSSRSYVAEQWAVRRLTPRECERLQRFPDDFTSVPFNGKPAADGPRYKALGNSMAVNVMRWLGQRIDIMENLIQSGALDATTLKAKGDTDE